MQTLYSRASGYTICQNGKPNSFFLDTEKTWILKENCYSATIEIFIAQ